MVDLSKYPEIIIWGACFPIEELNGELGSSGYAADALYNLLESNGYWNKIIFFVDSNPSLYGKLRFGKDVKKPNEILQHPEALVIINSLSIRAIQNAMTGMGAKNKHMIVPYYYYHGLFERPYDKKVAREHIMKYMAEIEELFDIKDSITRRYLDIIFAMRKKEDDDLYSPEFYAGTGENLAYFCDPELEPKGDVTFIDVGAFVGDSIEPIRVRYGERLKKCIAFEPNSNSFFMLKKYVHEKGLEDKVLLFPYALGMENKEIYFKQVGILSQQAECGDIKLVQKVFDDLPEVKIIGEPMVKMDIEGAEIGALQGMERLIRTYQPYLAICLYHKESDLYDIPRYIKNLCPDYRLVLRGGWHLECWAIPKRHYDSEKLQT